MKTSPSTLSVLGRLEPNRHARRTFALALVLAGSFALEASAQAAGLNDPSCRPTAARPYPAVVVHGQAGNFEGMKALTDTLVGAGYCVYARNYGFVRGGANGQDHLSTSAGQIGAFVNEVLGRTGAKQVDVIGHSAGTGVLDNYILKKGGAAKVHRMVSFGGLHHPYAHAGLANVVDAQLALPNLTLAARRIVPGFSVQQVVRTALGAYAAAGSPLGLVNRGLAATAGSNFTSDLFDPVYWNDLHGGLSENAGQFASVGSSERNLLTNDAAPNVCYTNIVAVADLLVGPATGFQDEASNVVNLTLPTPVTQNAHNDMLADVPSLAAMTLGLSTPCTGIPAVKKAIGDGANTIAGPQADEEATKAFEAAVANDDTGEEDSTEEGGWGPRPKGDAGGCSMGSSGTSSWAFGGVGLGLALAGIARRRRNALR